MSRLLINDLWDDAAASPKAQQTLIRKYARPLGVAVVYLQGVASQASSGPDAAKALAVARRMALAVEGLASAAGVEVTRSAGRVTLWEESAEALFDVVAQAVAHVRGGHHDHALVSVGMSYGHRFEDGSSVAALRAERLAVGLGPGVIRGDRAFREHLDELSGVGVHAARQAVSTAMGFEVFEFADYRDP